MKEPTKKEKQYIHDRLGVLCICALRYAQGRETYMPDLVRETVRPLLPYLSENDLHVMIDDCDYQQKLGNYGDERIDKPGWIAWAEELRKEYQRRKESAE